MEKEINKNLEDIKILMMAQLLCFGFSLTEIASLLKVNKSTVSRMFNIKKLNMGTKKINTEQI